MNIKTVVFNAFGFKLVKHGALAYIEKNGVKFFLKAGRKFSLKVAGFELTNKQDIFTSP